MTKQEAARLMATLAAAFRATIDEPTMQVWFNAALADCPADVGARVVERIVKEDTRFPSPARFGEVKRAMTPREPHRAITSGERSSAEYVAELIAKTRETLRKAGRGA